ncbi:MAG: ABC transporter permease [Acidobacteria bacterium]|nr:ABC transporter permease [Acidobacteriota bacterium]
MSALREILRFELRFHLRGFVFYIALILFFLLSFAAVTSDSVSLGGSIGNVHRNAPFVIMTFMLVFSIFSVFTTVAFMASAALRDYDLGTDGLFFSTPMRKRDYVIGRFAGSFLISAMIFGGVVLAFVLGSVMPWLEKERVGAFHATPYLYSFAVFILPTLFLLGAVFFCVALLSRSAMATYSSSVALFVGYVIASTVAGNNLEYEKVFSLLDPFGLIPFVITTRYWTVAERNSQVLPLEGIFLWNRLLWIGIGLAIFLWTLWKFRFETGKKVGRKRKIEVVEEVRPMTAALPRVEPRFGWFTQFASTLKLEMRLVLTSIPFLVILFLSLANVTGGATEAGSIFDTNTYPVTGNMLAAIEGGFVIFAILILGYYAGEIVFRERQTKLNEVVDATPVPTSAMWAGKLAALWAVAIFMLLAAMIATLGVQTAKGFHDYEFGLYLRGLFLVTGLRVLMLATFAFFLQAVTNNKYVGFLLMLLYIVSIFVLPAMHWELRLYRFPVTTPIPYSDMNGYGHWAKGVFWYDLYWTFFCGILLLVCHLLWARGTETRFGKRLKLAGGRFRIGTKLAFLTLAIAFGATGAYLYYQTAVLTPYRTTEDNERRQAEYEKLYSKYSNLPQPKITDVQADVDLYPERRAFALRGSYQLVNRTGQALDRLHVALNSDVRNYTISIPGTAVEMADKERNYTIYRLSPPMAPGATLPMRFTLSVEPHGIANDRGNVELVWNGTFINNFSWFPHIGYQRGNELQDRNKRKKYGLGPAQRYPKIDDPAARNVNQLTGESDWLNLDTTVSTSPDQIAIAPGYLQKEWTQNGRRYFRYKTTSPILGFWSYLSAHYEVKRDRWHDVAIEIYYDKKHPYNVQRMIDGVKASLDYFTTNFSPYQHSQVRILEFPNYQRFAQSFPNTIPFSESIGFIADLRDPNDIDYPFYVTAHEVGHQWWAHQVIGAQVQGTTMITETLAQYSALMVMEKQYGREKMRKFLRHELNGYLAGRGGELIAEMPLKLVEDQPYIHYRKGSLAMYALRDAIGEDKVNEALRNIIAKWAFKGPPYVRTVELIDAFRAVAPPDKQAMIHDLFETITLYDNKATEAKAVKLPDGRYKVTFTVESKKLVADGLGAEKEVPVDEWIDIGALAGKNDVDVLALEKRHLTQPKATFELIVKSKPTKAGIDPLNKLIDRNPEDNVKTVDVSS